jgi:hypothetical protein
VHGTAPLWRVDLLLPEQEDPDAARAAQTSYSEPPAAAEGGDLSDQRSTQTWRLVEGIRPLETRQRSLLVVAWSPTLEGARRPIFVEGELSLSGASIPAVGLFGDSLEVAALGEDGMHFRQVAPATRGGMLADLGRAAGGEQTLSLTLRMDGREEIIDFLAREVPFRRALASGWIETDWVAERPVLDLDVPFSELDADDVARALVMVQQVDGEVAVSRFRPTS